MKHCHIAPTLLYDITVVPHFSNIFSSSFLAFIPFSLPSDCEWLSDLEPKDLRGAYLFNGQLGDTVMSEARRFFPEF